MVERRIWRHYPLLHVSLDVVPTRAYVWYAWMDGDGNFAQRQHSWSTRSVLAPCEFADRISPCAHGSQRMSYPAGSDLELNRERRRSAR